MPTARPASGGSRPRLSSSGTIDHGRFEPGTIIADRYRILGRLGKGGMGEVYRADDLRLAQPVALKFLPGTLERDPVKLSQFHNEVRLARQVSHPNVCRTYDIGEADGVPFLTMEYVDGEDLGSLLRRIGRLPQDKGLAIARQLCAGLAAAHQRGVLHRDLKPANVMLDGEGNVRLTDFGLAAVAGDADSNRAGTPAYMSPEQLRGGELTPRSDLYALGLVLYELFTGRRAFSPDTMFDLVRMHETRAITLPTTIVSDLDPLIERTILRCLELDPADRPATALAVAAALPGGDPLAAALAAGETPSPQMVAAAGEVERLSTRTAIVVSLGVLVLVLTTALFNAWYGLVDRIPTLLPPDALVDRAQQMLLDFGYRQEPAATARGFYDQSDYLGYLRSPEGAALRATAYESRPNGIAFYYRTSPRPLIPVGSTSDLTRTNPPVNITGMTVVTLDTRGRLLEFRAVPEEVDPQGPPAAPDWPRLLRAAALDDAQLTAAAPARTPPQFADVRAAWTGRLPDRPGVPVHIEAAAYRGRPVYFEIVGPWSRPARQQERRRGAGETVISVIVTVALLALVTAAAVVARYNLRAGRGDRVGSRRLATVLTVSTMVSWLFSAAHVPDASQELNRFFAAVGEALFVGALAWTLYMALEPYVRRFWPNSLKGWTRLLAGHLEDPRVGRDVLIGAGFGAAVQLFLVVGRPLHALIGHELPIADAPNLDMLAGNRVAMGELISYVFDSAFNAMWCVFLIVGLRGVLRRMWLVVPATVAFYAMLSVPGVLAGNVDAAIGITTALASVITLVSVPIRFGLLATAVAFFFSFVLSGSVWSTHLSSWVAGPALLAFALLAAAVAYGGWAAAGGRSRPAPVVHGAPV